MKKRTRARELALQFLYQVDLLGEDSAVELDEFLRQEERDVETCRFARRLVEGRHEHQDAIDAEIASVAQNWHISRMAVIDRNVLRIATFELLYCDDIPPKVAINEAIELGKRFSTENSGAFINGILDRIKNKAKLAKEGEAAAGDASTPGESTNAGEVGASAPDAGEAESTTTNDSPADGGASASPWDRSRHAGGKRDVKA